MAPRPRPWASAICAAALCLPLAGPAQAQSAPAGAGCPDNADAQARDLIGLWRAEFDDGGQGATVLLEAHPQYAGSLSGAINRNGERAKVAADLEDGDFTMEESRDGTRIDATWLGALAQGACARLIRGQRQAESGGPARAFTLRRLP